MTLVAHTILNDLFDVLIEYLLTVDGFDFLTFFYSIRINCDFETETEIAKRRVASMNPPTAGRRI